MRDDASHGWIFLVSIGPIVDRGATSRLAEDDDPMWIASKAGNVVTKPFDGRSLISKPSILFDAWRSREAENAQAVVDGHDDDIFVICKILTIVEWTVWPRDSEAAAMEEGEDGLFNLVGMCIRCRLGPDIECETVLVLSIPETSGELTEDFQAIACEVGVLCFGRDIRGIVSANLVSRTISCLSSIQPHTRSVRVVSRHC